MRLSHVFTLAGALSAAAVDRYHYHKFGARDTNISIANSQPIAGVAFEGNATNLPPLAPKTKFLPDVSMMHQDGGNTGGVDFAGPTGKTISVTTLAKHFAPLLYDADGGLTAGTIIRSPSSPKNLTYNLNALDPSSLEVLSTWTAPPGQILNFAYMQLEKFTNTVVATSKSGHIYVVQRNNSVSPPSFETLRDIDLTSYLKKGEAMLNAMYDIEFNIWFTTGLIISIGDPFQNNMTLGYVTPSGEVHTKYLPGLTTENGVAVSGKTAYIVTGPAGGDTEHSNGTMFALQACGSGIETIWSTPYDAGSTVKTGDANRGSGTTPALLGDAYVAITDNADSQINLLIYHQAPKFAEQQLLCKIPLFEPGASALDNGPIVHVSEDGYSLYVVNDFNAPPFYQAATQADINGAWNNVTKMAPGGARIDVPFEGSDCTVRWEKDVRSPSVPVLSTKTGLLYSYEQDVKLSYEGEWVWYVTARDWETGDLEWRVRTGTGGNFSGNFQGNGIFDDGRLFQAVVGGLVFVQDGDKSCKDT